MMALRTASQLLLQAAASAGKSTQAWACFATATKEVAVAKKDWKAVQLPKETQESIPTAIGGAAFPGDLRSTSGLGKGDGLKTHTDKWLQGDQKSPMQYIAEAEPIKVEGPVVASYGTEDPLLGGPVEYINLKGTSREKPAVCKYTGNRYYSDPDTWRHH
mmetsp:Transcript_5341/g.11685  ORF Transcript_5341/g.11685 Transcript_5341/m.11685 type:complete len:160 (-) Transcript_5341:584-1063(-)|eukprot:CAMPEP_0202901898 /NCGR_PEP_ID=MMETSP1392-20130828/15261_1 /ASSEMBLY_ACC=CAM_ASM_000868 /TAXON_ID=225041 /ORGANISM="Chlamydomonas chlamydogama, Strain SAG 11-48b" /LENGTH=159 /DNA_ID=CAMNT_0049588551 /DNA_START=30 /DNA_END=509 /DNA_ORIENTATION=+